MSTCLAYCARCGKNTIHHDQVGWRMTCVNAGPADLKWFNFETGEDHRIVPAYICGHISQEPPMYEKDSGEMVKA